MSGKTHIDDYVKARLAERTYTMSPAYWEQAQALIADQKQKKRRFILWLWLSMGLFPMFLFGTAALWYPFETQTEASHVLPVVSQLEDSQQHVSPSPAPAASYAEVVPGQKAEEQRDEPKREGPVSPTHASGTPTLTQTSNTTAVLHATASTDVPAAPTFKERVKNVLNRISFSNNNKSRATSDDRLEEGKEQLSIEEIHALLDRNIDIKVPLRFHPDSLLPILETTIAVRHRLAVEGGLAMSRDFNNRLMGQQGLSFHPTLGLIYSYELKPSMRLTTGLRYSGRGGLNSDSTYISRDFGFGLEGSHVQVSPRRFHQVELPLGLEFRLKNRHYLNVGGYASYLMEVSGQEILLAENEEGVSTLSSQAVRGIRQGFRPLTVGASLGYQYYLGKGCMLGIQLNHSWMDATTSEFFQNDIKDRHLDVRIRLSYDLWRK